MEIIYRGNINVCMRHIKTYESFGSVNENLFRRLYNWIKDGFSAWVSRLKGELRDGADAGIKYLEEHPEELAKIQDGLAAMDESQKQKLLDRVESLDFAKIVATNESSDSESVLDKVARILGVSVAALTIFGSVVSAIVGLATSNGVLFVIGAVISIIAFSIMGASNDSY
jgi:hypothetical protein